MIPVPKARVIDMALSWDDKTNFHSGGLCDLGIHTTDTQLVCAAQHRGCDDVVDCCFISDTSV